ncbi:GNAT family N-acetyltransferase [Streptomyces albogriseolus]|uniref:GNAT family N-acetyltransferase n=1 Tax=Streptomyces albogriseolus TaxID=1887 RepID=UPI00345FCECB
MSKGVPGLPSLRPLREEDLPRLFEIQLDEGARQLAAFVTEETKDREAYLAKHRRFLADPEITNRGVEVDGKLVGSVAVFPSEGDIELTYWIHRKLRGRGVATAAVAQMLKEVAVRPIHARVAEDNAGSVRVLERKARLTRRAPAARSLCSPTATSSGSTGSYRIAGPRKAPYSRRCGLAVRWPASGLWKRRWVVLSVQLSQ